jgi:hypothetical protein
MPDTEQPKETKEEQVIKCPCCGKMTLQKPLEIKSLVLDEYMASIITGVPFAHTYTVHDSIDITVEMPSKKDAQFMYTATKRLAQLASTLGKPEEAELNEKLRSAIGMIQTYGTITSIVTRKGDKMVKSYTPSEAVREFCSAIKDLGPDKKLIEDAYEEKNTPEILSAVPDLMLRAIVDTHDKVYKILLDTGFNETFWKGIELA